MCGVIGMFSEHPVIENRERISELFEQSKIRGMHAYGFSYWNGEKIITQKFLRLKNLLSELPSSTTSFIGHCRYSTSGDYKIIANNQPLFREDVAMVFNGVISMATKEENERKYKCKLTTDNDGELFLHKFCKQEAWVEFVKDAKFSFAGLILNKNKVIAIRNKMRPLYRCEQDGAIFFASTSDIFRRSGFRDNVSEVPDGVAIFAN